MLQWKENQNKTKLNLNHHASLTTPKYANLHLQIHNMLSTMLILGTQQHWVSILYNSIIIECAKLLHEENLGSIFGCWTNFEATRYVNSQRVIRVSMMTWLSICAEPDAHRGEVAPPMYPMPTARRLEQLTRHLNLPHGQTLGFPSKEHALLSGIWADWLL